MNPINQDEINGILWRACDTFRGTVDPAEYKNYILVMLFVKYISDVWRDRYDRLTQEYGDDAERVQRALRYERFKLPADCDFQTLYEQRNADNLGEVINIALEAIEEANKEKLEGVFRNIDFNSEAALGRTRQRNERLKNLLNDFADKRLDLRPSRVGNLDVIGSAYEYLIGKFAAGAGKKAGEFYTPPEVSIPLSKAAYSYPLVHRMRLWRTEMKHTDFLYPANAEEIANIAAATGVEVLRGPLRYASENDGWQLRSQT